MDSEREAIAYLRDHLPDDFTVIHNFELRQSREVFEIDIALLGPHCVHLIDVKGTRGLIDVYGSKWYPEGRAPYHSPLAILRSHAKALKSLICDQNPTNRALGGVHVDATVLMTAPDAHVQDPGGQDAPAIAYLKKCATFLRSTKRIPAGRSTDIRTHFRHIQRAIVGRATPRSKQHCFGNCRWRSGSAARITTRSIAPDIRCSAPSAAAPPGCACIRSIPTCRKRSAPVNAAE